VPVEEPSTASRADIVEIALPSLDGHIYSMPELKFRSSCQPSSTPGSWKWELYVEGEEAPVAVGITVGSESDVDAAILRAKQFAVDNREHLPRQPGQ
jgi:hypothetical protein